jgi:hypothetical protein
MTRASKLIAMVCFAWFGLFNTACQGSGACEDIKDGDKCMARSDCFYNTLLPFSRTEGGRFECQYSDYLGTCMTRKCGYGEEGLVGFEQVCATVNGREYVQMISECYPAPVPVYPCEGHENQYDDCINEDVCAYCGNGRKDTCEFCDGELYEPRPCEWELDQGVTGGLITRCNATCDGYDTSDCTTD